MADKIHLRVVSASEVVLDRMVNYVHIPGTKGSVGVLAGHVPMLCAIGDGMAKCTFGQSETIQIMVKDGVAHVADNEVVFLVSYASIV